MAQAVRQEQIKWAGMPPASDSLSAGLTREQKELFMRQIIARAEGQDPADWPRDVRQPAVDSPARETRLDVRTRPVLAQKKDLSNESLPPPQIARPQITPSEGKFSSARTAARALSLRVTGNERTWRKHEKLERQRMGKAVEATHYNQVLDEYNKRPRQGWGVAVEALNTALNNCGDWRFRLPKVPRLPGRKKPENPAGKVAALVDTALTKLADCDPRTIIARADAAKMETVDATVAGLVLAGKLARHQLETRFQTHLAGKWQQINASDQDRGELWRVFKSCAGEREVKPFVHKFWQEHVVGKQPEEVVASLLKLTALGQQAGEVQAAQSILEMLANSLPGQISQSLITEYAGALQAVATSTSKGGLLQGQQEEKLGIRVEQAIGAPAKALIVDAVHGRGLRRLLTASADLNTGGQGSETMRRLNKQHPAAFRIITKALNREFVKLEPGTDVEQDLMAPALLQTLAIATDPDSQRETLSRLIFRQPHQALENVLGNLETTWTDRMFQEPNEAMIAGALAMVSAEADSAGWFDQSKVNHAIELLVVQAAQLLSEEKPLQEVGQAAAGMLAVLAKSLPAEANPALIERINQLVLALDCPEGASFTFRPELMAVYQAAAEKAIQTGDLETRHQASWQMGQLLEALFREIQPQAGEEARKRVESDKSSKLDQLAKLIRLLPDADYYLPPAAEIPLIRGGRTAPEISLTSLSSPKYQPAVDNLGLPGLTACLTRQEAALSAFYLLRTMLDQMQIREQSLQALHAEGAAVEERLGGLKEANLADRRPVLGQALSRNQERLAAQLAQTGVVREEAVWLVDWLTNLANSVSLDVQVVTSAESDIETGRTVLRVADQRPQPSLVGAMETKGGYREILLQPMQVLFSIQERPVKRRDLLEYSAKIQKLKRQYSF